MGNCEKHGMITLLVLGISVAIMYDVVHFATQKLSFLEVALCMLSNMTDSQVSDLGIL